MKDWCRGFLPAGAAPGTPDEESPLVPKPSGWGSFASSVVLFFNVYEPHERRYKADNPSPLMLLGMHMGMAMLQQMSILGAYLCLLANARILFPKCSNFPIIDSLFGLNTQTGFLCELSSTLLWTFPLMCCVMIPVFEYWDFCDSRLYYECLRSKVVIEYPDRDLLESPLFYFIMAWGILGLTSMLFEHASFETLKNVCRALFPFFFPVISFMATLYVNWDLKFYLITVANFSKELEWAKVHMNGCIAATEHQVCKAYQRKRQRGFSGHTSWEIFDELREELLVVVTEEECPVEKSRMSSAAAASKSYALMCGGRGWWMADLLWLPSDDRAVHFRISYRLFAVMCSMSTVLLGYLFVATLVQYQDLQGRISVERSAPWFSLKQFMITG